jgi:nucleoside-diphosphate-sugar epimerase
MGEQLRQRQVPVIGAGQGVWSFVHIEDAAAATVAALGCAPGAYNVVDGDPVPQRVWLPAFARTAGAPEPPLVTEEEALATFGGDAVYYATQPTSRPRILKRGWRRRAPAKRPGSVTPKAC